MIPTRRVTPSPAMVAYIGDLKAVLGRHVHLTAEEMLAGAAQFVGNLTAMQDQRRVTSAMVMEVVAANIEEGNQVAVSALAATPAAVVN